MVPMIRASDLSGLSCRPFCSYHCLTSVVHSARMVSPADVLLVRMVRWSCVSAMVSDDVGDRAAVDRKQQQSKHRPLRDAHIDFSGA